MAFWEEVIKIWSSERVWILIGEVGAYALESWLTSSRKHLLNTTRFGKQSYAHYGTAGRSYACAYLYLSAAKSIWDATLWEIALTQCWYHLTWHLQFSWKQFITNESHLVGAKLTGLPVIWLNPPPYLDVRLWICATMNAFTFVWGLSLSYEMRDD